METTSDARQIVREGIVSAVNPQAHSARVTFPDKDDVVSDWLPVLCLFGMENKSYALPDVGESVICLFASNDDLSGTGFIIGSRYDDKNTPKANSQDICRLDFKDGTFIQFDRAKSELRIECKGDIIINGKRIYLNE